MLIVRKPAHAKVLKLAEITVGDLHHILKLA